ncbi:hypothetical protein FRC08_005147, partial [Ceratobasidium sp. 394]
MFVNAVTQADRSRTIVDDKGRYLFIYDTLPTPIATPPTASEMSDGLPWRKCMAWKAQGGA